MLDFTTIMEFSSTPPPLASLSLPSTEVDISAYWNDPSAFPAGSAFLESCAQSKGKKKFSFYDGPPFATGKPHHGHVLAGTIKDVVTRYAFQTGHDVPRNFGWDCHGVPVENEINKKHQIKRRQDVLDDPGRGIKWYNDECRSIVMQYVADWRLTTNRLGRWIDFDNDYKTMDTDFMESVWSVFQKLYNMNLVYRGERVMPLSTALGTPVSKSEVGPETYKDASDPSVVVAFKIVGDEHSAEFVAWTTTPWTLPSNIALCCNAKMQYIKVKDLTTKNTARTGRVFVMAELRLKELFKTPAEYEILAGPFPGSLLKDLRYEPLFDLFRNKEYFRVVCDDYVTSDSGTGIVHLAPAFGEDDHRVCMQNRVVIEGEAMPCPVDDEGFFTNELLFVNSEDEFAKTLVGKHVKTKEENNANDLICKRIKAMNRLMALGSIVHKVPHCSRSQTPLIYKAVKSWFIRVESGEIDDVGQDGKPVRRAIREAMLEKNDGIRWVPEFVGKARFHEWLKQARDWNVSRNRFWGTPIPIWESEDGSERVCVGSIAELERLSGVTGLKDIHREFVDGIEFKTRPDGPVLRRIVEVFDCWFESGSMPYATRKFMFGCDDVEGTKLPEGFPADFIAEGLDQTRGWFYTLMILSTSLFKTAPFKNVVVNGLVLAADGKKMSKSLRNYPPPEDVINRHGADALRLYLVNSPVVRAEPLRFVEDGVQGVVRDVFLPLLNALRFFLQNVKRPQAVSQWDAVMAPKRAADSKNVMDSWILAEARDLVRCVRREMDLYRLYNVTPRLLLFVDSLTNWYVRLNRLRLKGRSHVEDDGEDEEEDARDSGAVAADEDNMAALSTLYEVLLVIARLMAPFTPFFTEYAYQKLCPVGSPRRTAQSIHFLSLPDPVAETPEDLDLIQKFRTLQTAVQLGRVARGDTKIKVPVLNVTLVSDDARVRAHLRELVSYVKEELNAFEVVVPDESSKFGKVVVRCNDASLGKKYKLEKESVKAAILNHSNPKDLLLQLEEKGEVEILPGKMLTTGDVTGTLQFAGVVGDGEKFGVESNLDLLVVINRTVTKDVENSGAAREFKSVVQKMRKKAMLSSDDKINVFCLVPSTADEALKERLIKAAQHSGLPVEVLQGESASPAQEPNRAIIVGYVPGAALFDVEAYPETQGNAMRVWLTHPFVRVLNSALEPVVQDVLRSMGCDELKAKEDAGTKSLKLFHGLGKATKTVQVFRGKDFEFSV